MTKDSQKKILLLIPNLDFGGAQRVFYDLSVFLATKYKVCESVFNLSHGHVFKSRNEIISLEVPAGKNLPDKVWRFIQRCRSYRKLKSEQHADVSISHLEGANYVNILAGGKAKTIIVEHGSKVAHDENRTGLTGWCRSKIMIPLILRRADKIVVVSTGLKKELATVFGIPEEKIIVINNSFNLKEIKARASQPVPERFAEIFSKPVIITSGRLSEQKFQAPLLDILSDLKNKISCSLVFLGDGHLLGDLQLRAATLGLSMWTSGANNGFAPNADVYFLGYQDDPFKFIAKSEIFVLPSAWEGFPLALCEAMICGTPVMSTDCRTGPREILAPGTDDRYEEMDVAEFAPFGVLMPLLNKPGAVGNWSETLRTIMGDSDLRRKYSEAGAARMNDFSDVVMMNKWISVIE